MVLLRLGICAFGILLLSAVSVKAEIILVPADQATIQEAIDAAENRDEIVISKGIYYENINFLGKDITVRSENPDDPEIVEATIINGSQPVDSLSGSVVTMNSEEGSGSVLSGLSIKGGVGTLVLTQGHCGGGLFLDGGSPTIRNCIITANQLGLEEYQAFRAGGIYCRNSSSFFSDTPTTENAVPGSDNSGGGGVYCEVGSPVIINCVIARNSSYYGGGFYGRVTSATILNCTIAANTAISQGGGVFGSGSAAILRNSIVWGNNASTYPGIAASADVSYSLIQGGYSGTGNISGDPYFTDLEGEDYHLLSTSLCINAGDPAYFPDTGDKDIDGEDRIFSSVIDIGADEAQAFLDCNENAVPDWLDLEQDGDCNSNGIPDDCDAGSFRGSEDCNGNSVPDECEDQSDCDSNDILDFCETDSDGDGLIDACDQCPEDAEKTAPGLCGCDLSDEDADGDLVAEGCDNCPGVSNVDQADIDDDGIGDACDPLRDCSSDSVCDDGEFCNGVEACVSGVCESGADPCTTEEVCIENYDQCLKIATINDGDNDGISDEHDNCPQTYNPNQLDTDANGIGNECDNDDDGDEVPDQEDECPTTPLGTAVSEIGCPIVEVEEKPQEKPDISVSIVSETTQTDSILNIDFTLTVSNVGNVVADNVVLRASLEDENSLSSVSDGAKVVDGELIWPAFSLASRSSVQRTYSIVIDSEVISDGALDSVVEVDSDDEDENPANNSDKDIIDVPGQEMPPDDDNDDQGNTGICGATSSSTFLLTLVSLSLVQLNRRRRRKERP